jgi:hypothetical protein
VEKVCLECGRVFETTTKTTVCDGQCRTARKNARLRSVEARHSALLRVLASERVPRTDKLYSERFYEALIHEGICIYCHCPLSPTGIALDRIVNPLGHRSWNVVACCSYCNSIKGDDEYTFQEMSEVFGPAVAEIRRRREANTKK